MVVGRVTAVEAKRWKVDLGAHQTANLNLTAVDLPGGVQRRRQEEDRYLMRKFYQEGDVIVAEV